MVTSQHFQQITTHPYRHCHLNAFNLIAKNLSSVSALQKLCCFFKAFMVTASLPDETLRWQLCSKLVTVGDLGLHSR